MFKKKKKTIIIKATPLEIYNIVEELDQKFKLKSNLPALGRQLASLEQDVEHEFEIEV